MQYQAQLQYCNMLADKPADVDPLALPSPLIWVDLADEGSRTLNGDGSRIASVTNKITGAVYTVVNGPIFEPAGFGGRPCMKGFGGVTLSGIDPIVTAALAVEDVSATFILVIDPVDSDVHYGCAWLAIVDDGGNALFKLGAADDDHGRYWAQKIDAAATDAEHVAAIRVPHMPQVVTFRLTGTTFDLFMNDNQTPIATGTINVGALTGLDTVSLLSVVGESASPARMAEALAFGASLSTAQIAALAQTLMGKWGVGWNPLTAPGLVWWQDALEAQTYEVTPGTFPELGTVQSLYNIASAVEWTEVTNPPWFEPAGMKGRPCFRGDGAGRIIIGADSLPATAVNGVEKSFTTLVVLDWFGDNSTDEFWSVANSGVNTNGQVTLRTNSTAGRYRLLRTDDTGNNGIYDRGQWCGPGPTLIAHRYNSATPSAGINRENLAAMTADTTGTITANRAALFGQADLTPGGHSRPRIGCMLMYDGNLSDADMTKAREWLTERWGCEQSDPGPMASMTFLGNGIHGITGTSVLSWGQAGGATYTGPAGKEPSLGLTDHPTPHIKFIAANSDVLTSSASLGGAAAGMTIVLKGKLDQLPAPGQFATLCSVKYASGDDWFEIVIANQVAGMRTFSFARQSGLVGNFVGFDFDVEALGNYGPEADGAVFTLTIKYDGATGYEAWLDGVAQVVSASGAYTRVTGDKGSLGGRCSSADAVSQGIDGKIFKMAAFARQLTGEELGRVQAWALDGFAQIAELHTDLKVWIDMLDPLSFNVVGGEVVALRNKASNVVWNTPLSDFPDYEATGLNGLPCMKGNGVDKALSTTEAAAIALVTGDDTPMTIYVVGQSELNGADETWCAWGHSAQASNRIVTVRETPTEAPRLVKRDDAGTTNTVTASGIALGDPTVFSWATDANADYERKDGELESLGALTAGVTSPDRFALFTTPQSTPQVYGSMRIGEIRAYAGKHTLAKRREISRELMLRWGILGDPRALPGLVAWFDMSRPSFYTVAGGLVTSITNLVSGVAWNTAATSFPLFEGDAINGLPCMRGEAILGGGATNRGIISTETAVVNAFNGTDLPFTVVAVTDPVFVFTSGALSTLFGAGNSGFANDRTLSLHRRSNDSTNYQARKRDDAALEVSTSSLAPGTGPRVMAWVCAGTTMDTYYDGAAVQVGQSFNTGVTTPNRVAVFCRPDSSADGFSVDRLGELLIFNRALTDREVARASTRLATKWAI